MARQKTISFRNVAGLNKALRKLPKEYARQLSRASNEIAQKVAEQASSRARSVGGIARHVAPSIRAGSGTAPVIRMGSALRLPTSGNGWERARSGPGQTVGDVIWGAEFGALNHGQFSPWRGSAERSGYFLWPTIRENNEETQDRYLEALSAAHAKIKGQGGA